MKKLKVSIIIIAIITVMLLMILFLMNSKKKNNNGNDENNFDNIIEEEYSLEDFCTESWDEVTMPSSYYKVKSVISNYYECINKVYNKEKNLENNFKNILAKYIEIENVDNSKLTKIVSDNYNVKYEINKMYEKSLKDLKIMYLVELNINNKKFQIVVIVDKETSLYTIVPSEYIAKSFKSYDSIEFSEKWFDIKNNENNSFKSDEFISLKDMTQNYLNDYIYNLGHNLEKAYNNLDEDYKKTRFGTFEKFKKYIEENYKSLSKRELNNYNVSSKDGIITYMCKDQYDCVYIFYAKAVMNYSMIMDLHTKNIDEFVNKYSTANNTTKAAMNINKIIDAVNTKDYDYIYSKLSGSAGFSNVNNLKDFLLKSFNEFNIIHSSYVKEEDGIYIFTIEVAALNSNDMNKKKVIIGIELKNDDFSILSMK